MAGHQLIDAHLAALARRLPADAVDELADGLNETWQHHLSVGLPPAAAARAAIAEFGTVPQIVAAFVAQSPGRRTARLLLATGPLVGGSWGASLLVGQVWAWPVPPFAAVAYGLLLIVVVATLLAAATSRHGYRRARLGCIAGAALAGLDLTMLAAVALLAPAVVAPMLLAVPASLTRIAITLLRLPRTNAT